MDRSHLKAQLHLLGEAFPDDFIFVMVFDKETIGNDDVHCDILCNPTTDGQMQLIHNIIHDMNPKMYEYRSREIYLENLELKKRVAELEAKNG